MTIETLKWRPRGPVGFAPRIIGTDGRAGPGAFKFLACVDQLSLENSIEYIEHKSKCSALDALDFRQPKSVSSNLTISFSDFVTPAMVAALLAIEVAAEGAPIAVNNESMGNGTTDVEDGDSLQLGNADPATNITALQITDSSTVPQTLVSGTDYILDATYGYVTFPDVSGFTQPFIADYSHKNPLRLAGLKAAPINRWLTFQGFNASNENKLVKGDFFNVAFSPSNLDLLPDDNGLLEMQATLLIDTTRPSTDPLGQYYSIGLGA